MMRVAIAGIWAGLLTVSAALAHLPETSPIPPVRPGGQAQAASVSASMALPPGLSRPRPRPAVTPGPERLASAGLTRSPVPRTRPVSDAGIVPPAGALVPALVVPALVVPALAMSAPPARPIRPDAGADAGAPLVPSAMTRPKLGAPSVLRGAVCGVASIKGTRIAPILSPVKGCGLAEGVRVTAVAGVPLSSPATVDCETATALNAWTEKVLIPAVGTRGGGLARIDVLDSYACRPRNNVRGNRISEHGSGKAVDIGGFTLANGTSLTVLDGWSSLRNGPLMKAAFRGACGLFGTTLGPAANSFHRNHFHFDTARYRAGSYCE